MGAGHAVVATCGGPTTCTCQPLREESSGSSTAPRVEEIFESRPEDPEAEAPTMPEGKAPRSLARHGPSMVQLMRHRIFSPHVRSRCQDHYSVERLIGEGSYGNVYEASAIPPQAPLATAAGFAVPGAAAPPASAASAAGQPSRKVAVKCFVLRAPEEQQARRASFERERAVLAKLEHPHIVKMFECFEEPDRLWIIMELCRGGELYDCVADAAARGAGAGLDEPQGRMFYQQMLQAVTYLHSWQIVHRDLKTENFLLVGGPGSHESDIIKLCDFGTALQLTPEQPRAMERIGTLSYVAPEVYNKRGSSLASDVWSIGVVLYVMLMGASPFRTTGQEPQEETIERITHGRYDTSRPAWAMLSASARDLICRLLVVDEQMRMPGVEALRHPWFTPEALEKKASKALPAAPIGVRTPYPANMPLRRFHVSPYHGRRFWIAQLAPYAKGVLALAAQFARLDLLQQLVITVCAQMTPEADLPGFALALPWYELFFVLDRDEDGRVEMAEFVSGMRTLLGPKGAISDEQLMGFARPLDVDGSGAIDWAEWMALALLSVDYLGDAQEPLRTVFRALDRPSSDGVLGIADLLAVVTCDAGGASSRMRDVATRALVRWAAAKSPAVGLASLVAPPPSPPSKRTTVLRLNSDECLGPPTVNISDLQRALQAAGHGLRLSEWLDQLDGASSAPSSVSQHSSIFFACCESDVAVPYR